MSEKLALLGGPPVAEDLLAGANLVRRADLERSYLLDAYDNEVWDDWPNAVSTASLFQQEWAEFCGSAFCALVTNGTHALQVALESLDVGVGDEVIVPGLTWQATASAVCDVNAVPVLVDVDPETLCIDPELARQAITPRTRAIVPVHLYHRMADMDRIAQLASEHDLHVVEDCAHTHGSRWGERGAGTLGDFGSFSFQRSKLVNAGEGGALLMQDESLYWKVVSQRSCGREYNRTRVHSGNYRLTSFQAAVLRGQLAALRQNASRMDHNGQALDQAVDAAPGVRALRRQAQIARQCSYCYVFLYDPDAFDGLNACTFRQALSAELGVGFGTTYTPLSHSEVYYPHTKRRHHLSPEYVKAITPSRWSLPVADELWLNRAVVAPWRILACPPERAGALTDAVTKIHAHRHALLEADSER